jgi:hypothetical protein
MRYDDAVASLFQAPLDQFVAERKRLAGELKTAGDKPGAAKLLKLGRPPISAWAVDQLWWQARDAFEALFETAQDLRDGKLQAMAAHRDAIARLRAHASKILTAADHGATEATLRKVTQTLSALAAAGDWEPDAPGALSADRDPPGFEAVGISNLVPLGEGEPDAAKASKPDGHARHADGKHAGASDGGKHAGASDGGKHAGASDGGKHAGASAAHAKHDGHGKHAGESAAHAKHDGHDKQAGETDGHARPADDRGDLAARRAAADAKRLAELEEAAARAEAAAEQRRREAERAKRAAERHRLEAALRTARGDIASRERDVNRLERELAAARDLVDQARAVAADLDDRLAQLAE